MKINQCQYEVGLRTFLKKRGLTETTCQDLAERAQGALCTTLYSMGVDNPQLQFAM